MRLTNDGDRYTIPFLAAHVAQAARPPLVPVWQAQMSPPKVWLKWVLRRWQQVSQVRLLQDVMLQDVMLQDVIRKRLSPPMGVAIA